MRGPHVSVPALYVRRQGGAVYSTMQGACTRREPTWGQGGKGEMRPYAHVARIQRLVTRER
uniref:Uncharacterized protein n=1 Tax=Oryza glumipatula TaxID=40148 RepID=A0A0E0ALA6_9ORYZ